MRSFVSHFKMRELHQVRQPEPMPQPVEDDTSYDVVVKPSEHRHACHGSRTHEGTPPGGKRVGATVLFCLETTTRAVEANNTLRPSMT